MNDGYSCRILGDGCSDAPILQEENNAVDPAIIGGADYHLNLTLSKECMRISKSRIRKASWQVRVPS